VGEIEVLKLIMTRDIKRKPENRFLVLKTITGSRSSANNNQLILYHFASWKLHNNDMKCLVSTAIGIELMVIRTLRIVLHRWRRRLIVAYLKLRKGGRYGVRVWHRGTRWGRETINKPSIGFVLQTMSYLWAENTDEWWYDYYSEYVLFMLFNK